VSETITCPLCWPHGDVEVEPGDAETGGDYVRCLRCSLACVRSVWMKIAANIPQPIPMLLFCPRCTHQHVDAPTW